MDSNREMDFALGSDGTKRDALLARTFLEITERLVGDFDVIEVLTMLMDRSVELFDVTAAGVLLAQDERSLRVVAASSEEVRLLELLQLQNHQGPCLDCYRTGHPVIVLDISADDRWPLFGEEMTRLGFSSVVAVPLRHRERVLGAINLFRYEKGVVDKRLLPMLEALAGTTTLTIIQSQAARETSDLVRNLEHALESRVVIEQAKGMIAQHLGASEARMDRSFRLLRAYARSNNRLLREVAAELVTGALSPSDMDEEAASS